MHRTLTFTAAFVLLFSLAAAPPAHAGERARQVADTLLGMAGAGETLLPSEINRRLRDLDEDNPIEVTYPVTGVRAYDRFFLDLAKVQGTLALAEHAIDSTNAVLDGDLVAEVFGGDIFVDAFGRVIDVPPEDRQAMLSALVRGDARAAGRIVRNFSSIQFRQVRENFMETYGDIGRITEFTPIIADEIADLPSLIVDLGAAIPELVSDAPTAFTGTNAVYAPRVAAALAQAATDLADLPDQVTSIASSLAALGSTSR